VPAVPGASGAQCGCCLAGRGPGAALVSVVTGQSPSCPQPTPSDPPGTVPAATGVFGLVLLILKSLPFPCPGTHSQQQLQEPPMVFPPVLAPRALGTPLVSSSSTVVVVVAPAQQLEAADTVPWGQLLWSFRQRKLF